MNIVAIVQARMGSTRLPNKVMKLIGGKPLIEIILTRLSQSKKIGRIVLATSKDSANEPLVEHVSSLGYSCYRGSESDVLDRYYQAAILNKAQIIIRITGDCPLVDVDLIDEVIEKFISANVDYASNTSPPTFPDGLDIEVMKIEALELAHHSAQDLSEREHVTPFIKNSELFSKINIENPEDLSLFRWTVDEPEDLQVIEGVFSKFHPNIKFGWRDVLSLQDEHPEIFASNANLVRNEGQFMGTGQKLWKRAKQIIPGGNMLLSKRAEMFLPEKWPSYFSKAKGCKVWDMDGNEYIDMSIMGVGTNILGYGHETVDAAVRQTIASGNMSTLNCPEEVYLAERLIAMHPWAGMVKFARTGGEANAVAIRIARAAAGRDNVAICGYHGWHDWYLSANLADDKGLDGHLLPGLEPNGVPRNLKGTVFPFSYNKFSELELLVSMNNIGVIKMEVSRNSDPENDFLLKVRELATKKNIVLIFDECTSGFRQSFGGLHKIYGVEPDMAIFGKAIGNGYAITAIIGRKEVMQAAQTTFISSTFWTERIGSVAALKTLDVMEEMKSWEIITKTGLDIRAKIRALANQYGLEIEQWGLPALTGYTFKSDNALLFKTFITQEMLKKGYLAGNSVYVCTAHTPEILTGYFEALEPIFSMLGKCQSDKNEIDAMLESPICHSGFKRLN